MHKSESWKHTEVLNKNFYLDFEKACFEPQI